MLNKLSLLLLPYCYKWVLSLICATCRVRWHNKQQYDQLVRQQQASITCFWHENVLIIPWVMRNRGIACLISRSKDGDYIAAIGRVFGHKSIRGGSSAGSTKATRESLRVMRKKQPIAITPDGPRGPAHTLQTGVLWLGALGNAPIIPVHIEATRQWRFKSWDGQKIPKPFSTIYVSIAEPMLINRQQLEADEDGLRKQLELQMMGNVARVEKMAGTSS